MHAQTINADKSAFRIGLIGQGIKGSRTPAMHMAQAAADGIIYAYDLLDIDDEVNATRSLDTILDRCESEGYVGVNVTYPFKIEALEFVHELHDSAKAVGAVNTIVFEDQKRIGYNTDTWGFAEGFRREFGDQQHQNVLLIGAGGAGVAVARALMKCGVADLYVFDLNQERAHELAQKIMESHASIRCHVITDLNGEFAGANVQGIVNATPVGMAKLPGLPFPVDLITPEIWVIDIIYFPIETELLRSARSVGCKTMGGDSMAVFQAVRAYELFTKRAANPAQMRAAFSSFDAQIPNQTLMNEEGGI